jgi:hypothetical protein
MDEKDSDPKRSIFKYEFDEYKLYGLQVFNGFSGT